MSAPAYVILGAGQAGGRAAEMLRAEGFDGHVLLVGAEPHRPYERPPLSKGLLLGETAEDTIYLRPADFYAEQRIDLELGVQATHVDPAAHWVRLSDGREIAYEKLLLATGVRARTLPLPGVDLEGVHTLRTLADARTLIAALEGGPRVLVVGAGFIGAEVAAACRKRGLAVTMLETLPVPLQRALGTRLGALYAEIHREQGVDLRCGISVAAFRGQGRVAEALLEDGAIVPCDLVVIGVGCIPETGYLAGAGLARGDGVVVDENCRTSLPDIYAAGDVARWWHPLLGEHLRVEHWDNAENQGVAAARAMLGRLEPYAPVPYFWSDQYHHHLQYLGHGTGTDQEVVRGSLETRQFIVFYLRDGLPVAALCLNSPRESMVARRLIGARTPVDAAKLADPGTDLRSLVTRKAP
jgi:3-phenylpropionate/trans-cinnamate dioxygenase ferredoxin reductase subunit